jgi:putative Holliday junction resolvase
MNLLGIDVGERRIGVAMGESTLRLALPVRVIERESLKHDAQSIQELVREYDADRIVIGLPLLLDGSEGEQAARVRGFVDRLRLLVTTPFEFWDERFSTVEAMNAQRDAGHNTRSGRATVDASAAAVLLQSYLDANW